MDQYKKTFEKQYEFENFDFKKHKLQLKEAELHINDKGRNKMTLLYNAFYYVDVGLINILLDRCRS